MKQNPCRAGAQMLWSVQDGPNRMNKCGITPNTEQAVLDSAVGNGLRLGKLYNMSGQQVLSSSLKGSNAEIDVSRFVEGLYCIQVLDGLTGILHPILIVK